MDTLAQSTNPLPPLFAGDERAAKDEIERALEVLQRSELLPELLEATGAAVLVLNPQRQILLASREARQLARQIATIRGQRPGEALGCIHSTQGADGCGTGEGCRSCGAAAALVQTLAGGGASVTECLLTCNGPAGPESHEYEVQASPLMAGDRSYLVLSFRDISADKRREALERIFFHDVLNTISALRGYSQLLHDAKGDQQQLINDRIEGLVERLLREVNDQRALSEAESGTLDLQLEAVRPTEVLAAVAQMYDQRAATQDKHLEICATPGDCEITTDPSLLTRVLGNMVKNALEATGPGAVVRLVVRREGEATVFGVWNPGNIPPEVARHIFVRSFSTKGGRGRGLGTYSMKLLGERFLGGHVGFTTSEAAGTEFTLRLCPEESAPR